jgi:predicted RNase H-like nuclease (RuvC/YqgF family)
MDPLEPVKVPFEIISFLKNSRVTQFALTLVAGVAIGAVFYPTKHIEEKISKTYEEKISQINTQHQQELSTQKDTYEKQLSETKQVVSSSQHTIDTLQTSIRELKSREHYTYYKIVHPDGTIEEKKVLDRETDDTSSTVTKIQEEYKQQLASIETRYETIHQERVAEIKKDYDSQITTLKSQISTYESSKVTDINKKNYGIEAGYLSNQSYYIHGTADVFGPVFVGIHGETGTSNSIGAGIGLRL